MTRFRPIRVAVVRSPEFIAAIIPQGAGTCQYQRFIVSRIARNDCI